MGSSDVILDIASLAANTGFVAATVASLIIGGRGLQKTLRQLGLALLLARTAVALALVALIAHLLDIPNDGLAWPALGLATAVGAAMTAHYLRKRRDLKGERVMAEAERTVRNYTLPTWER